MATDNDAFFHVNGLDMFIYFNCENFQRGENNFGGCTTYLASALSDNDSVSTVEETEVSITKLHKFIHFIYTYLSILKLK